MVNTGKEIVLFAQHIETEKAKARKADAEARRIQTWATVVCALSLLTLVGVIVTMSETIDRLASRVMNLERHTAQMDAAVTAAEIRVRTLDPSVLEQLEAALFEINRRSISNQRGIQIIRANEERM